VKIVWKVALAALALPFLLGAQTRDLRSIYARINSVPLPVSQASVATRSILESGNEKIDPSLRLLMNQSQQRGFNGMEQAARALSIPTADGQVEISVYAEEGADPEALRRRIEDAGGEVSGIVENAVMARVPLSAIAQLGSDRGVYFVAQQGTLHADYQRADGGALAEGVLMVKANKLHQRGIRGRGVKIGLLDFGFNGYRDLEAKGLVPTPVATATFPKPIDFAGPGTVHGAACAEIIHAMAPDAQLYIAMAGNGGEETADGDIVAAAQWLAAQKVDIISFSGGGHYGPINGKGPMDKLVDQISAKGILWVNAAGNEGDRHWSGPAVDNNHDGFVDIGPHGEPGLAIQVPDCGARQCPVKLLVTWDDWGPDPMMPSATEDLDAFLFLVHPDGSVDQVAQSVNPQQGRGAPKEAIFYMGPPNQIYLMALRMTHITRPVRIHVVSDYPWPMYPLVKDGSIGIPATSFAALAVGAVDVTNAQTESYSSRGPTDDGRVKPDVAAPDNTLSTAYKAGGHERFQGTSAACPHVSGYAALLKQMNPEATAAGLKKIVMEATRRTGSQPNNDTGNGIIDADTVAAGKPGSPATGILVVPGVFGGRVGVATLERLLESAGADSPIKPKVVVGRDVYHPGDGLKIGFKVEQDCYYLLIHRDSEGHYTLLAPSPNGDIRLRAGEKYSEPSGDDRTIRIRPPGGVEHVMLICAGAQADLESWQPGTAGVAVAEAHYEIRED
jgi:subtilisin family serine protease